MHAHAQNQPIGINGKMRTLVLVLSGWHSPRSRFRHLSEKISYMLFFFFKEMKIFQHEIYNVIGFTDRFLWKVFSLSFYKGKF